APRSDLLSGRIEMRDGKNLVRLEQTVSDGLQDAVVVTWLDPQLGYMVVCGESFALTSGGRRLGRLTNSEPIKVHDKLWLPAHVVAEEFAPQEVVADFGADRPWVVVTLDASCSDLNSVDESLFVAKFTPGTGVRDNRAGVE